MDNSIERKPYTFVLANWSGCAIGISDFGFAVTVCAESEKDAEEWGKRIALLYSKQFGIPPHGIKLSADDISKWGSLIVHRDFDYDSPGDVDASSIQKPDMLVCNVGELPPELTQ